MKKVCMTNILMTVAVAALLTVPAKAQASEPGVTAHTKELLSAQGCCTSFGGFNFSGILAMSPDSGGTTCINCVGAIPPNNLGIKFPESVFFLNQGFSVTMTFHSQKPGPCTAGFGLYNVANAVFIAGNSTNIADCGSNNIWVFDFFGNVVPNNPAVAGDNVVVGIIRAADGTVKTDFEQVRIQ